MKKMLLVLVIAMSAVAAQGATVTLTVGGNGFADQNLNSMPTSAVDDHLFMLIGDVDGDGFESLSAIANNNGFLADDDVLVLSWAADYGVVWVDGATTYFESNIDVESLGLAKDSPLALVWFSDIFGSSPTSTPGAGKHYGVSQMHLLPDVQGTWTLNYSLDPASTGMASNVTVPEPASMLLLAVGGLFIARRRKA